MKKILNKNIKTFFFLSLFVFVGCNKDVVVDNEEKTSRDGSSLNNPSWGTTHHIDDYFYDLNESVQAQFLYYNVYMTRGANTVTNEAGLNPYIDTLNFSTFPNIVAGGGNAVSFETLIGLTPENVDEYATLYEMDETNCTKDDWCNEVLYGCLDSSYKGGYYTEENNNDCSGAVDVDFDFSYSISSSTGQVIDTDKTEAVESGILSPKASTFEVSWLDIDSLIWDNSNGRYTVVTADEAQKLTKSLADNSDTYNHYAYIGIIDSSRKSIEGLTFVDRLEWERFDTTLQSPTKEITLAHTFSYNQVKVPDDSPMFRINGDCNQNAVHDAAEEYFDYGRDWCPDKYETGSFCTVVDSNGDGSILDESACNCNFGTENALWASITANTIRDECTSDGGYWLNYGPFANECLYDPNGDNWRDCGWDGRCPGDLNYENPDPDGSQGDKIWGTGEEFEKNGQYDYDIQKSIGEKFTDRGNGVLDVAEYCFNVTVGLDGGDVCAGVTPFEDRNCNGKWDSAELEDQGNGVWDDAELFIDNGNGQWESGEPLYTLSDRMQTFIVDYTDPLNPLPVTKFAPNTQVKLYYEDVPYVNFLETVPITASYSESFYDIYEKRTIYTNKVIDYSEDNVFNDFSIVKTRWYQDVLSTSFNEDDLNEPYYGFEYSIPSEPSEYGYDYHIFKKSNGNNIIKMVHPEYFKYYGYFEGFSEFDAGTWQEDLLSEEVYIYTADGYLRDGEYVYSDTTIITSVADYYIENSYEVKFLSDSNADGSIEIEDEEGISIPFSTNTFTSFGNGDTICVNDRDPAFEAHPSVNLQGDAFIYKAHCPPVDITLTNVYKITKTKTITMIGTGLELGLRNTIWLGSNGPGDPLGILRDKLEYRWSEPYWKQSGSQWKTSSRLDLRSLSKGSSGSLARFFTPVKKISLDEFGDEFELGNDAYRVKPSYGIHRMRAIYGK